MKSTSGSTARARANPTRCFMPPESSLGYAVSKPLVPPFDHLQRPPVAVDGAHAAGQQGRFDVFQDRQPGKQRETLEDDGDIGICAAIALPCHSTWPAEGFDNPVSIRSSVDLPEPEGPSRPRSSPADGRSVGAITSMRLPSGCG